ncbi:AhpC/TSA family protein [Pedobacter sp. MC2016-14]|uniref:TlpA disulfide reductase family protein n=1 Tax=Pedobacter sp. MC2016-14 TaxID=2897327 RepID=UPI001E472A88|nr:TlpA disulfide reductase family protein [Pedobacter sp. MC2016-14]MCD0488628.1 AhpC/TSA family protein [Pedobacter sp. MC2016-14]
MKKLFVLLISLFPLCSTAQITVKVSGKSTAANNKTLLFFYEKGPGRPSIIDSCKLKNGTYSKVLTVNKSGVYLVGFSETDLSPFWADQKAVEINFSAAALPVIKGDVNNELMDVFNHTISEYHVKLSSRDPKLDRAKAEQDYKTQLLSMAEKYATVPAVIHVLSQFDFDRDAKFLQEAGAKLLQANPDHVAVKNYVFDITRLNVGQPATDVAYLNTAGGKESLKSVLGKAKYTLVDFWGTYCVPCRAGIPGIKKLYAQYHSKGLEVLAISLDTKDDMWKKSLAEEAMPWPQGRTEDGGRRAMLDYRFNGIPYLALFDQNGNIVALNLQHEALEHKLKELMGEPDKVNMEVEDEGTAYRSPEEEAMIQKIVTAYSLQDYQRFFKGLTAANYKTTFLKNLNEQLTLKAYQLSKLGWSLETYYNNYIEVLQSRNLSEKEKLSGMQSIDRRQISFLRGVLGKTSYQKYLLLRDQRKLSY